MTDATALYSLHSIRDQPKSTVTRPGSLGAALEKRAGVPLRPGGMQDSKPSTTATASTTTAQPEKKATEPTSSASAAAIPTKPGGSSDVNKALPRRSEALKKLPPLRPAAATEKKVADKKKAEVLEKKIMALEKKLSGSLERRGPSGSIITPPPPPKSQSSGSLQEAGRPPGTKTTPQRYAR